jgi:hypothetical protein
MDPSGPDEGQTAVPARKSVVYGAGLVRVDGRDVLYSPDFDPDERRRVVRAAQRWLENAKVSLDLRAVGLLLGLGFVWMLLVIQLGLDLVPRLILIGLGLPLAVHVGWQLRRRALDRRDDNELRSRVIIPEHELHDKDKPTMRRVVDAVVDVARSRAQREGHLSDGLFLLSAEQWRIAEALVQLSAARNLMDATTALPEHVAAVGTAEEAVDRRVAAVLAYADAVRRVDRTLSAVDAAVRSDSIHHKVRDAIAALGDDQALADLVKDAGTAEVGIEAALEALRGQADALRSLPTAPLDEAS